MLSINDRWIDRIGAIKVSIFYVCFETEFCSELQKPSMSEIVQIGGNDKARTLV